MITDNDIKKMRNVFVTKDDAKKFATRDDLKKYATNDDLKKELSYYVSKNDFAKAIDQLVELIYQRF